MKIFPKYNLKSLNDPKYDLKFWVNLKKDDPKNENDRQKGRQPKK